MLDKMSVAKSVRSESGTGFARGKMPAHKIGKLAFLESNQTSYGIQSLMSDNMNHLLGNEFNKQYLVQKNDHDEGIKDKVISEAMKGKNRNDTHANKLKTEMGVAHAKRMKGDELPEYTDAHHSRRGNSLFKNSYQMSKDAGS